MDDYWTGLGGRNHLGRPVALSTRREGARARAPPRWATSCVAPMNCSRPVRQTGCGRHRARAPLGSIRFRGRRRPHLCGAARPGALPARADRLLLSDAGIGLRGRGRRPGDDGAGLAQRRTLRGPFEPSLVAVPDRHQRLHRHATPGAAPGTADGDGTGLAARRVPSRAPVAGGDMDHPHRRRADRARARRPCRGGRVQGFHPTRLRHRPPAPPAPPASHAGALRGPALAGDRGGRAPGDERGCRQQRAAASTGHAVGAAPGRAGERSTSPTPSCSSGTSMPSSATTSNGS